MDFDPTQLSSRDNALHMGIAVMLIMLFMYFVWAMFMRWVFRINHIVRRLDDISAKLGALNSNGSAPREPVQKEVVPPKHPRYNF